MMPSANPTKTQYFELPSPTPPDPPDVPGDVKALADRLEQILPRWGKTTGQTNGSGALTITHGMDPPPAVVVATLYSEPEPYEELSCHVVAPPDPFHVGVRCFRADQLIRNEVVTVMWFAGPAV